jgi:hypothetical protein
VNFMQTLSLRRAAFVILMGFLLSACASPPEPAVPTDITFAVNTVLNVDATSIDVRFASAAPKDYPHVGHRSPVTFEAAFRKWAQARFQLTGNTASALRVIFSKGEITEELLPVKTGFSGSFKKEQAAKYEARLGVELELVDPNGKVLASASGEARNTHTVPEDATENDKRIVWAGMIAQAFDSLDQELIPGIHQGMGEYIR